MDAKRFDDLARRSTASNSRRAFFNHFVGSLAAALPIAFGGDGAEGKKKRKRKKRCTCPVCQRCLGDQCISAPNGTPCRDCGRCADGVCAIPVLQPEPPCGLCAICESGGICVRRADNAPCGQEDGRCLNGQCNPVPNCVPAGTLPCFGAFATQCCSGQCCSESGIPICCQSQLYDRCQGDGDCDVGLTCIGFRCL